MQTATSDQILRTVDFELDVQEPFFSQLKGIVLFAPKKSLSLNFFFLQSRTKKFLI